MRPCPRCVPSPSGCAQQSPQRRRSRPVFLATTARLRYFTLDECRLVLNECAASTNSHTLPVAKLCLATGARWDEAESITRSQLLNGQVRFARTKNGRVRTIPVPDDAVHASGAGSLHHSTEAFAAFTLGPESLLKRGEQRVRHFFGSKARVLRTGPSIQLHSEPIASLRLEGFDVTPADADRELPTRQAALEALQNAGQEWDTCGTPAQKQKG